ncbi:fungal-specific transcription factor domain protein [Aspergillus floccosus]
MEHESPKRRSDSPELPRSKKRAKYTQVACNECKRRKLKCSGESICTRCARDNVPCVYAPGPNVVNRAVSMEQTREHDGVSTRFQAVDRQIETLQNEMRAMAARMRQLEAVATSPANTTGTVHTTTSTVSSSSANIGHQRIMNRPMSPTYVGPTSAEFGISARQKASDDSDAEDFVSTTAASPVAPSDTEAMAGDPLGCLDMEEALRLVTVYENTVGIMYPCVDLDSVRTYVKEYYRSGRQRGPVSPATINQDWFFARDVEVLKIILATALLAESHGRSERAALLADSVEDRFSERMKIPEVDMKELLILTLLSIFHSYRDDEVIAWRLIGLAVRGSMQLGLHCQETWLRTGGVFPGELQWTWATRLFWCIYVLDRKWSFGTGLPFAIQDSDMDINLPEPGASTPYLTCMITYARLSTKIWELVVGWRSRPRSATSDYCSYLDFQVQQWIQSIPPELRFDPSRHSEVESNPQAENMAMLQVLLALQANQLRILVYRQNLMSSESIESNIAGASTAVEVAKSTVHMLNFFSRVSDIYFQRPEPFNYFLISALAALFLAVLHAPTRFSQVCRPEFYVAVEMVRKSSTRARTSRRLQKIIRSLKLIRLNLGGKSPRRLQLNQKQPQLQPRRSINVGNQGCLPAVSPASMSTPAAPSLSHPQPQSHVSGIPTPQASAPLWPMSSPDPVPTSHEDPVRNTCDDLTSFFEMAGGLYFEPRGTGDDRSVADSGADGIDVFQAEDEALTKVMAGLL